MSEHGEPSHSDGVLRLNGGRPIAGLSQLAQRAVLVPLRARTPAEAQQLEGRIRQLQTQANAEQHPVLAPTHVMMKGDEIVGYLSLAGLPMVQAWFDSQHKVASDSLKMIEHGETIFREQGVQAFGLCCAEESPFTPHLERLGFRKLGATVVWLKNL